VECAKQGPEAQVARVPLKHPFDARSPSGGQRRLSMWSPPVLTIWREPLEWIKRYDVDVASQLDSSPQSNRLVGLGALRNCRSTTRSLDREIVDVLSELFWQCIDLFGCGVAGRTSSITSPAIAIESEMLSAREGSCIVSPEVQLVPALRRMRFMCFAAKSSRPFSNAACFWI
jgi:hypothetical protein